MMWIVRVALRLPYTFAILAVMIVLLGVLTIFRTPVDIFPSIDIPVVSVIWTYTGETPEEMAERIVTYSERAVTTTVNDLEHTESQSMNGVSVVKIFFQPNANIASAVAQVTSVMQTILRVLPPGITPPFIIQYSASNVPVIQMSVSSQTLPEQSLNDFALNFVRIQLANVQGAQVPLPYGGKVRQIMVDIDSQALYAKGLSATDVVNAVTAQNVLLPAGDAKIGARDYFVRSNNSPEVISALNDLPIKQVNGATVYIRDVAQVRNGFAVQSNIVRENGRRSSLLTILKSGSASTLAVVQRVKDILPQIKATLPPELNLGFLFDQSIFVKASINGVLREGLIAACLTALMILVFLGSWRSTLIVAVSIPLSILVSIILLSFMNQTLNIMTLGGLSLAVGILVDDATVEIENIHRNLGQGKPIKRAILDGAQQIATPAFVATSAICIVFTSVVFLSGVAKYLFTPLALAVVFAVFASYLLSRTVVPTMAHYLLRHEVDLYVAAHHEESLRDHSGDSHGNGSANDHQSHTRSTQPVKKDWIWRQHEKFNRQFERFRSWYRNILASALHHRRIVFVLFGAFWVSALVMLPFVGQDFFPQIDGGQFVLHVRALPGTRIEETERVFAQVENVIRASIPAEEITQILDNIGLPSSGINLAYGNTSTIGPADGDILVSLKESGKTFSYVKLLRQKLKALFPDYIFYFAPADIVTQILNFGLPAAVDIQVSGPLKNAAANNKIALAIAGRVARVPGAVDVHVHQVTDAPALQIDVDRTKANEVGLTQSNVANSVLTSLSSSGQGTLNYWLDPTNGVSYLIAVQVPQYKLDSIDAIGNLPITTSQSSSSSNSQTSTASSQTTTNTSQNPPQLLSNLGTVSQSTMPEVVNHYNIQPVYDIYANTQDRDLGGVSRDINRIVAEYKRQLPRGSKITVRGQVQTMNSSFVGLGFGLVFAIVLVYCLMVVNFQSWLDPLIIMMALPSALAGIVWMLFISQTTFSVPSLTGSIICIGVATSNSILLITFANEQRLEGENAYSAALAAGYTRLRPVLMTALAMIIGMVPMSLGLGEGGSQNAP
ncbi:MAG: efflux RND transporter permease subunit, partial [Chroococcidiopsidaceae cyanobacterium CP_BM_ER_R8_30]|nr:efflux RND transporter permease subunit [Chroococcidiopsidaceae cyanobacterium CP_BM_ER_R8_30]